MRNPGNEYFESIISTVKPNITEWSVIDNGYNSFVYEVKEKDSSMILRAQLAERSRFKEEAAVISRLQACGVDYLPKVVEIGDLSYGDTEYSYSLEEKLPGVTLDVFLAEEKNEDRQRYVIRDLGDKLRRLHVAPSTGYGLVDTDLAALYTTLDDWAESIVSRFRTSSRGIAVSAGMADILQRACNEIECSRDLSNPKICHGDLVPRNVLVDPRSATVSGILDLEHSKSHQIELDLAYWRFYWSGDVPFNELMAGYRDSVDAQLLTHLAVMRGIDAAAYWLEQDDHDRYGRAVNRLLALDR